MSTMRKAQALPPPLSAAPPVIAVKKQFVLTGKKNTKNEAATKKAVILCCTGGAICFIVLLALIGRSIERNGTIKESSINPVSQAVSGKKEFQAEHEIVSDEYQAYLNVTVRGKATKLAVILINPEGKSEVQIIESDQMITNCKAVNLPMEFPQSGPHVLTVKTFAPEEVVVRKELNFSLNQLLVKDVKFNLKPKRDFMGNSVGDELTELEIALSKDGNLPIEFTNVSVEVGGKRCRLNSIESGRIMIRQQHMVKVGLYCDPTQKMSEYDARRGGLPWQVALFRSGDRYPVKGKLFFGKNREKFVEFEKELVVR